MSRILFIVTEDWTFATHRLHLATSAIQNGYDVALLCHETNCKDEIERGGIKVYSWDLDRRSVNPFKEVRAILQIHNTILEFAPDVVHAVALKPVIYASIASRFHKLVGWVFALGGLGFVFSSNKFVAQLIRPIVTHAYRFAFRGKNTRLILQNPDDVKLLKNSRVLKNDIIRLIRGAGVEIDKFIPRPMPDGVPLVILPARMLWDKGIREFVDAAKIVKSRGINARFALVGDRDEHNPECVPESQLNEWVQSGFVEWWGRRTDMPEVYAAACVVCLPSYREGLPKALLEAASCSRPIVTFDVPGCREVVESNLNGYLVTFGRVDELAEAIQALLVDENMRNKMGRAGRKKILGEFSHEHIFAETADVWKEVINIKSLHNCPHKDVA